MSRTSRASSTRGLLVALVGILAVGGGAWLTADAPARAPERTSAAVAPPVRSSIVCPDPGASGALATAVLPLAVSSPSARVEVGDATVDAAAGVLTVPGADLGDALPVVTSDPATPGLAGAVGRTRPRLAATPCVQAGSRAWFTGAGAEVDHAATLELVNPESGPAVVRVRVLGPDGPVETLDMREVSVPPGERVSVELTEAAPAVGEVALEVRTSRGRVAAFVTDRVGVLGAARPATELLPSQATPRRTVVLGGLPARADGHVLVVANPGEFETLATVAVQGADGTFVPEDAAEVRVPPGGTAAVDLGDAVGRPAAAVRVQADAPVTAVVRSRVGADITYAGPVRTLGPAAGAVLPPGTSATVQLSSVRAAHTVVVQAYAADGTALEQQEVEVPAAGTLAVALPGRARTVVVRDGGTRVRGAVVLRGDTGVAALPLRPGAARGRTPVAVPVVR